MSSEMAQTATDPRYCTCDDPKPEAYPNERHFVEYHCGRCGKEI